MGLPGALPWKTEVGDEATGEAKLGVGADDEPRPAIGLVRRADRGRGPTESSLLEPKSVLDVEAVQVGTNTALEVWLRIT